MAESDIAVNPQATALAAMLESYVCPLKLALTEGR